MDNNLIEKILTALADLRKLLPKEHTLAEPLPDGQGRIIGRAIVATIARLQALCDWLDPIQQPLRRIELFAPSTIGRLLGRELTQVKPQPLATLEPFYGSGVYALFYRGNMPVYRPISGTECPIYVGKGNPRKRDAKGPVEQGLGVYRRLSKHRKNIGLTSGLAVEDFEFSYLVTESGWQGTAEEFLIALYQPIWNGPPHGPNVCSGFGKHGDKKREELSAWDIIHSGRTWAENQKSLKGKTLASVSQCIEKHFRSLVMQDTMFWKPRLNPEWLVSAGL